MSKKNKRALRESEKEYYKNMPDSAVKEFMENYIDLIPDLIEDDANYNHRKIPLIDEVMEREVEEDLKERQEYYHHPGFMKEYSEDIYNIDFIDVTESAQLKEIQDLILRSIYLARLKQKKIAAAFNMNKSSISRQNSSAHDKVKEYLDKIYKRVKK